MSVLWATNEDALSELTDDEPPPSWLPREGGSRLIVATFPPDDVLHSKNFDLDYAVVLSGEISLELDGARS